MRPKLNAFGFPSRNDTLMWTPAEKAIADAMRAVEDAGAHPLLTDAVNLLIQARDKVADHAETVEPRHG